MFDSISHKKQKNHVVYPGADKSDLMVMEYDALTKKKDGV